MGRVWAVVEVAALLLGLAWTVIGGHVRLPDSLAGLLAGLQLAGLVVGGLVAAFLVVVGIACLRAILQPPYS